MNILTTIANSLQLSIANTKARTERNNAIHSALIAATNRHPDFRDVMFDQSLLTNQAADLIEPFLAGGALPTADSLAAVWAERLPAIGHSRERAVANIMPMIEDFLYVIESSNFSHQSTPGPIHTTAQPKRTSQQQALSGI